MIWGSVCTLYVGCTLIRHQKNINWDNRPHRIKHQDWFDENDVDIQDLDCKNKHLSPLVKWHYSSAGAERIPTHKAETKTRSEILKTSGGKRKPNDFKLS